MSSEISTTQQLKQIEAHLKHMLLNMDCKIKAAQHNCSSTQNTYKMAIKVLEAKIAESETAFQTLVYERHLLYNELQDLEIVKALAQLN